MNAAAAAYSEPGAAAERLRARLAQRAPAAAPGGPGRAAVALILREPKPTPGRALAEPELLFVQRAERAGDPWSGHMAFPGGRWEPSDPDLRATALRETREEVGFEPSPWLGYLGDFQPLPAQIVVGAHAFEARGEPPIALSCELRASIWVPLRALHEPGARITHRVPLPDGGTRAVPALHLGPYVVWGLTLRIAAALCSALGQPLEATAEPGRLGPGRA